MSAKRRDKKQIDWRSDWWLWPSALLLVMGGLGQAAWMLENTPPEGIAPLSLLLWIGVGVAGVTLPIYWLAYRWWPVGWVAIVAWVCAPVVYNMASRHDQAGQIGDEWLYNLSPLLLLLLLGIGLSGVMLSVSWVAGRYWPGPAPNIRPLREGFLSGLFAILCGWLLINRAFFPIPVILLASALVSFEVFFVMRESSR